jgi:hypothetical protein
VRRSSVRALIGAFALIGAPVALVAASTTAATAATLTVTTTADGGAGSLREAIETLAVNGGGDTVVLGAGATYQLTCGGGGQLTHGATPLTIEGNGATIVQTCAGDRVFDQGTAQLLLFDVTLTGGNTTGPGAGLRSSGSLGVHRSTIRDNVSGPLSAGGGIATVGSAVTVLIEDSTISGNTARNGGGIGVTALTSVTIINSTITGNHADGGPGTGVGGGLETNGGGTWILTYATIAGNTANSGGANVSIGSGASIFVSQSVIAAGDCSLNGNAVTSQYNVTTETTCGLSDPTDALVVDPMLAPLGAYGGPTLTMAPLVGSPLIDFVPNAVCPAGQDNITADQRGFPRPDVVAGLCDAGAVEGAFAPSTPTTPTTPTRPAVPQPLVITPAFTG